MDPETNPLIQPIINFVESLPPLLQFLLGIFITLGMLKVIIMSVKFFDKKKEEKK